MYYTLAGLGLTTHISSIFGGGRRWYHYVCRLRRKGGPHS
jgi:hypothetical protein